MSYNISRAGRCTSLTHTFLADFKQHPQGGYSRAGRTPFSRRGTAGTHSQSSTQAAAEPEARTKSAAPESKSTFNFVPAEEQDIPLPEGFAAAFGSSERSAPATSASSHSTFGCQPASDARFDGKVEEQEIPLPEGFAARFGSSGKSAPFTGASSRTTFDFQAPPQAQSSRNVEEQAIPLPQGFAARFAPSSGSSAAGTPFAAATSGVKRSPFSFVATPQASASTVGSTPASQGVDAPMANTFPWTASPSTAPASQQSSFKAGSDQAASHKTEAADQSSLPLPREFAAVFGASRAAADTPLAGASSCARHSTLHTQAAPSAKGTKAPGSQQKSASAAFGVSTTSAGTGHAGAPGMEPSRNDSNAAVKEKVVNGPFVFNLTAAAGHVPAEPPQTANEQAAPTAGKAAAATAQAADSVPSSAVSSAASGLAAAAAVTAATTAAAAAGDSSAATGNSPAAGSIPPAAGGNPSAVSGTPPAAGGEPPVASGIPFTASAQPPTTSGHRQPMDGTAAEEQARSFGAASFGRPTFDNAAPTDQHSSASSSGSQVAPSLRDAEPSLLSMPFGTSVGSAPLQGGFPTANPFLVPQSTPSRGGNLFSLADASSGQAGRPFAFGQQTPVVADAAQHEPPPFGFGQEVHIDIEPGALRETEQSVQSAWQQAGTEHPFVGFDNPAAAASSTSRARSAQTRLHSKPKHYGRK